MVRHFFLIAILLVAKDSGCRILNTDTKHSHGINRWKKDFG